MTTLSNNLLTAALPPKEEIVLGNENARIRINSKTKDKQSKIIARSILTEKKQLQQEYPDTDISGELTQFVNGPDMFKPLTRGNAVIKVKKETKSIVDTDEITTMVGGMNDYLMGKGVIRVKLSDLFIDF